MKKLLLLAAMAAIAFGASADGYKLEKLWNVSTPNSLIEWANTRQGFGMDGKFYINDKGTQTIYIFDENGKSETTLPGGPNCGISRDEAGHILISTWAFPGNAFGGGIRVIDPATGETLAEYTIPEECGFQGRCDFIGFAKGDMTQNGTLYLTGGNTNTDPFTAGVAIFTITDGEVDFYDSYLAPVDGLVGINTTVINYYKDLNGEDALAYAYRSGAPSKLTFDDQGNIIRKALTLPDKGNSNGLFPLVWDGKEMFIYTSAGSTNYLDCFAISEDGAEAPILEVPQTISALINNFQANWLNAEIDAEGVTIYHYYPGGYVEVYRLTKDEPVPEPKKVYMLGGDDQPWDPTNGTEFVYDAEKNVYTATVTFPAEYNFFGFTTELAENNDDGGWAYIEPFRFGAIADEGTDYWYSGEEDFISLTWDEYHAIRIPAGEYNMTVNLEDMKLFIEEVAPAFLRGDVDMSGDVKIGDVTALINYLLSGNAEGVSLQAADCDQNGEIKIGDVTTLINYLLSGTWPE